MKKRRILESVGSTHENVKKIKGFKLKSDKGSITLFVLVSMLFMLMTLLLSYTRLTSKNTSQDKQIKVIQEQYKVSNEEIKQKYDEVVEENLMKTNYSITYNLDGGTNNSSNPSTYTAKTDTFVLKEPTKVGYVFAGWTGTDLTEATKEVTIEKGSKGDRQYTATWETNNYNYTVTFNANRGTEVTPITKNSGEQIGTLPTPTREGYTFKGWNGKNLFDEESILMAIDGATYEEGHYIFNTVRARQKYGVDNSLPVSNFKENTPYTFTIYGYIESSFLHVRFDYTDGTTGYGRFNLVEEGKFSLTSNSKKTLKEIKFSYGNSSTAHVSHIQLEEGSEATEYEPHYVTADTKVTLSKEHTLTAEWQKDVKSIITGQASGVTDGLIRYYDATNNVGNGHSDNPESWKDLSGHQDGTINGPTAENGYIVFNASESDWINLGQITNQTTATLEAELELNSILSGEREIICNYESGGYGIHLSDGKLVFQINNGSYISLKYDEVLETNRPYHVAGTYDGNSMKLYIDGVEVASRDDVSGAIKNPGNNTVMAIGENPSGNTTGGTYFTNMNLYTARIYEKALTAEEIKQNMNADRVKPVNIPSNSDSVKLSIIFDSEVTGFDENAITVENGKKGTFTKTSDAEYILEVTNIPLYEELKVTIPDGSYGKGYSITRTRSAVVTFDSNGGNGLADGNNGIVVTGTKVSQEFTTAETQELKANVFTRTGYDFLGWAKTTDGEVEFEDKASLSNLADENGNMTLYAKWRAHTLTLQYYANGAQKDNGKEIDNDYMLVSKVCGYDSNNWASSGLTDYDTRFEKTGYTATKYWHVGSPDSEIKISQYTKFATAHDLAEAMGVLDELNSGDLEVNVYAGWKANTYTVTYDANGGTVDTASKKVVYEGNYGELPTPTRKGYTFKGWNGKNLFNEKDWLLAINNSTYDNESGYYIFKVNDANNSYGANKGIPFNEFKQNTQYTCSALGHVVGNVENNNTLKFYFSYKDGTKTYKDLNSSSDVLTEHTSTSDKTIDLSWFSWNTSNVMAYISYIQLEEGAEATEYEPYYITSDTEVVQHSDHTLTALWEENEDNVSLDSNGKSAESTSTISQIGSGIGEKTLLQIFINKNNMKIVVIVLILIIITISIISIIKKEKSKN